MDKFKLNCEFDTFEDFEEALEALKEEEKCVLHQSTKPLEKCHENHKVSNKVKDGKYKKALKCFQITILCQEMNTT